MKKKYLFLLTIVAGCQSQKQYSIPNPQFILNHHMESIELMYEKGSEQPTNIADFEIKTRNKITYGRTSRHIHFPTAGHKDITHKRIQFLKDFLTENGYKAFNFKYDRLLPTNENKMSINIHVYNVLPPKRNNTLYGDDWAQGTAMRTNELYMMEDVAVLFDHSSAPDVDACYGAQAVKNYDKPKDVGANNSSSGATGLASAVLGGGAKK